MEAIYELMGHVPIVLEKIHGIGAPIILFMGVTYELMGFVTIALGAIWGINNRMTRLMGIIFGLICLVLSVFGKIQNIGSPVILLMGVIYGLMGFAPIAFGLLLLLLLIVYMIVFFYLSMIPPLFLLFCKLWIWGLGLIANGKSWKFAGYGAVLLIASKLPPVILGPLLVVAGRIMFRKMPRYR